MSGPHHRYRSWEHCYRYFHGATPEAIAADRDHAALPLGFYLASWGMYRARVFFSSMPTRFITAPSTCLFCRKFSVLWQNEIGAHDDDAKLVPLILRAIDAVRDAYRPFAPPTQASDILVTKVLLGTFGCLPLRRSREVTHLCSPEMTQAT
jgi:hypothetical protein